MQRRAALASLVRAAQSFAIDCHNTGEPDAVGFGKGPHELLEVPLESLGVQSAEDAAERIVAGDAMFQPQELPQQRFLGLAEQCHVGCALRSAQRRCQRDNKDVEQLVQCVRCPRVGQTPENLGEFLHRTPHAVRESFSESISLAGAT